MAVYTKYRSDHIGWVGCVENIDTHKHCKTLISEIRVIPSELAGGQLKKHILAIGAIDKIAQTTRIKYKKAASF